MPVGYRRVRCFVLGLVALPILGLSAPAWVQERVAITALLEEVQRALVTARDRTEESDLPPLKKVTLTLSTTLERSGDGSLSFFVVSVGAAVSRSSVQEITLELTPPSPADTAPVSAVADALVDAIVAAARVAKAGRQAAHWTPPLHVSGLAADVQFVVKQSVEAGLGFEILPVTAKLEGTASESAMHGVKIEFGG